MIFWSSFCSYMLDMKGRAPAADWARVRRAGLARLTERLQAGRADSALDFSDLVSQLEDSLLRAA